MRKQEDLNWLEQLLDNVAITSSRASDDERENSNRKWYKGKVKSYEKLMNMIVLFS